MGATAVLSEFPEVVAVDAFLGAYATPGQIIVDTLVRGSDPPDAVRRGFATLTITAREDLDERYIEFTDLRMSKAPRQYGAFMRTIWEDSRWKLRDFTMARNYNSRDCQGNIYPDTERTIMELVQEIADVSGLNISAIEDTLPDYKPSAPWKGMTAAQALDQLLNACFCRMLYGGGGGYVVSGCNTGDLPDLGERLFRPVPQAKYLGIRVQTAPITYEKSFQCKAVVWDQDNELEEVENPEWIFNNWEEIEDVRRRSKYIHSAMRLWRPEEDDVVLLGRRALTIAPGDDDSAYASMVFKRPELAEVPMYGTPIQPHKMPYSNAPNQISLTGGGEIFQCEQAHLVVDGGGQIKTDAEVLCAYHKVVKKELERRSSDIVVGGAGGMLKLYVDWIRPVESTEPDIDGSEWDALFNEVEEAVLSKYSGEPQHVTIPTLVPFAVPTGKIGGVRYVMKLGSHAECYTVLAINFDPQDARAM
jgi:hypothetical protein